MDPYQVLGIRPDADTGQIRAAYRQRARNVHPDAGGDSDAFTRLQDAYRRALTIRSARGPGPGSSAPPPPPRSSRGQAGAGRTPRFGPGTGPRPPGQHTPPRSGPDRNPGRPWNRLAAGWGGPSATLARLWARHQGSVVAMLATQVVVLSSVVLAGPTASPGAAVVAALLAGVGAGYALYMVAEVERWLSWRERQTGRATDRPRWWRANGPPPR